MDPILALFLVNQRHKEILHIAAQERLIKSTFEERAGKDSLDSKIREWVRARVLENGYQKEHLSVQRRFANPGCTESEASSG